MSDTCRNCYSNIGLAISHLLNPPPRFCDKCIDASDNPSEIRRILSEAYTTERQIFDRLVSKRFIKY